MAEVLGEWRRSESLCAGALVLWLKDLRAGAGWGLLDHRGAPKAAYHHVRRALAPVAVWSVDEGLGGVVAHIANDGGEAIEAVLRVSMYRDLEVRVEEVETEVRLEPRTVRAENVEGLLGRFVDASFAYRFGPPAQDLIVLSLEHPAEHASSATSRPGSGLLSQAFRLPAGRPTARETATQLGLTGTITDLGEAGARLTVSSRRFAYGVRVRVPGFTPEDDAFSVEPGRPRQVWLRAAEAPTGTAETPAGSAGHGHLTALNLAGRVHLEVGSG
jgi:beta-mannosidase